MFSVFLICASVDFSSEQLLQGYSLWTLYIQCKHRLESMQAQYMIVKMNMNILRKKKSETENRSDCHCSSKTLKHETRKIKHTKGIKLYAL